MLSATWTGRRAFSLLDVARPQPTGYERQSNFGTSLKIQARPNPWSQPTEKLCLSPGRAHYEVLVQTVRLLVRTVGYSQDVEVATNKKTRTVQKAFKYCSIAQQVQ